MNEFPKRILKKLSSIFIADAQGERDLTRREQNALRKELEDSLRQIQTEKEKVATILNSMAEQVVAIDLSGKIILCNRATEKLFGIRVEEVLGKTFMEAIRQAKINELLRAVLDDPQEKSREISLFLPEEKFFEARALPLKSADKDRGALLVMHDITRIHKLEQVRREFVANVSHELRTPLTSIQGFAETLLSGALSDPEHSREFIETIQAQAERLTRLVDDLLNLSALEAGRKKPNLLPVLLPELLKEVEVALRPLAQKSSIRMKFQLPAQDQTVFADRDQLKQVFLNLVDNAIKFNQDGGEVTVESRTNGTSVTVSIKDTGIGMDEKNLSRIFERFYRADKARSRDLGGTGLGLAIVKHILDAHRGAIQVESSPESGTTFQVTLPKIPQN